MSTNKIVANIKARNAAHAKTAHTASKNAINALIAQLQAAINTDERDGVDWADVGTLAEIQSQLTDTVHFATGSEEE